MGIVKRIPGLALLSLALLLGAMVVTAVGRAPAPTGEIDPKLKEKALSLNKITGEEPEIKKIKELIKDADGTKKLLEAASAMAKEKKQPFNANATIILAKAAYGIKEYNAAEQFYRINLDQAKELDSSRAKLEAYAGLISLLYNQGKFAETEKTCLEFLEQPRDDTLDRLRAIIDRQMIMAVAKQKNQADRAIKIVDERMKANPKNWRLLEFKARIQREIGQLDEAIKSYDEATARIKKDDQLIKDEQDDAIEEIQYAMTGVYVEKNQIDKATAILEKLLEKKPDDPTYNNDLGFIWADHDLKLAESEKMIRKAIDEDRKQRKNKTDLDPDEDKDNGAFLDSLGWVLFKLKKFKEAKPYLLDAAKDEDSQHIEIYDHLAEVHMALGEKAEAIAAWKKGVEIAGPSKREQERKVLVEKKLKDLMK